MLLSRKQPKSMQLASISLESRVQSALGFLEDKGRIERVGNQYRVDHLCGDG